MEAQDEVLRMIGLGKLEVFQNALVNYLRLRGVRKDVHVVLS